MRFKLSQDQLKSALDIGNQSGSGSYEISDAVTQESSKDLYRIKLSSRCKLSISVKDLDADANVRLYNSKGKEIKGSYKSGIESEFIERSLKKGTYFIRIANVDGCSTNYSLNIASSGKRHDPGRNRNAAYNFGAIVSGMQRNLEQSVGDEDPGDYYRVKLKADGLLNLGLTQLKADIKISIESAVGEIIKQTTIAALGSGVIDPLKLNVKAGSYFIRITSLKADTKYKLSVCLGDHENDGDDDDDTGSQAPNSAPSGLQFLTDGSYYLGTTYSVTGQVTDINGATDLSKLTLKLVDAQGNQTALPNPTVRFTADPSNPTIAKFAFDFTLPSGATSGSEYKIQAMAYDKANVASTLFTSAKFFVTAAASSGSNFAPSELTYTTASSYTAGQTYTVDGSVIDRDGFADLSSVNFRLLDASGQSTALPAATTFTQGTSTNQGRFAYNMILPSSLVAGQYKLVGRAMDDKFTYGSEFISTSFTVAAAVAP